MSALRIGLALSGGGSLGAFTVGALRAINQGLNAAPYPVISGTSTGSLIGTLLTTMEFAKLVRFYSRVKTHEIVQPNHRLVANLFGSEAVLFASAVLGGRAIFDTTPLRKTIEDNIDFARGKGRSRQTLLIYNTVDLRSGKLMTFNNKDHSERTLANALLASASMPILMEPVRVKHGTKEHELVDGGVLEYLPLRAVFHSGVDLDHIIAISTSPLAPKSKASSFSKITEILGRTIDLLSSEIGHDDYYGAVQLNAILQILENGIEAGVSRSQLMAGVPPELKRRLRGKRTVPVTFIGPKRHIAMDSLEFNPQKMKKLMKDGFDVAKPIVKRLKASLA